VRPIGGSGQDGRACEVGTLSAVSAIVAARLILIISSLPLALDLPGGALGRPVRWPGAAVRQLFQEIKSPTDAIPQQHHEEIEFHHLSC
jgi:hypothetical protein